MRLSRSTLSAIVAVAWAGWAGGGEAQETHHDLLVSSRATNSVKRYDGRSGAYVDDLVPSGTSGLAQTQEILLKGPDILVVGLGTPSVLRFDRRGGAGSPFTSGYVLNGPTKANWGPDGNLYVSQWGSTQSSVAVFDGSSGAFLREATPDLDRPMDQAWDAQGTLYVVSFGSRDVRRYDGSGTLIDVFVPPDEHLEGPVNLWFDEAGDLIIVDWTSGTIQRYSGDDGSHVARLVSGLTNPEGWDVGPDGRLYVGEWNAHRVRPVNLETGEVGSSFTVGGGLGDPNGLLFIERLPDFGLSASATTVSLAAGAASVSLSLTPLRDLAFDAPISLGCTSSSASVTCLPSVSSVTPGSSPAVVDLHLSRTTAAAMPRALILLVLLGTAMAMRGRRVRLGALALLLLSGSSGCGDDPVDPRPSPDVQVVVTASSGALQRSVTITVTGG